jgi:pimeloyl-ACP methyl ester carboxylesterase
MSAPDLPPLRWADVDGPIAYREWEGPQQTTFVLIHGLGGAHANWVRVGPGLAGLGRVIALDFPGFGYSPRAGRDTGLMSLRRTLARFIEQRASGRIVVCGNSMGGAIAILHAAVDPGSVAGLVLTGSVFPWVRGGWPHPVVLGTFSIYRVPQLGERLISARLRTMEPDRIVRLGFRFVAADPRSIPQDVVSLHVDMATHRASDEEVVPAFVGAARSMLRLGARPDVARRAMDSVRCPVLVLHGRRDRLVPAAFAEAALARETDWRGRIFPDLGHAPMLEAPGRWLAEVADWCAEAVTG